MNSFTTTDALPHLPAVIAAVGMFRPNAICMMKAGVFQL